MKKNIIFLFILMFSMSSISQTMHVHKTDGSITSINLDQIEKITFALEGDSSFIDPRDGLPYETVVIGDQTWMAENLAYLPSVSPPSQGATNEVHYYVFDYMGSNVDDAIETLSYKNYGVLYSWEAALTACPTGWHLPSQAEWEILENHLGTNPGTKMKSETGWVYDGNGDNSSGFNAFPVGCRKVHGQFSDNGRIAYFWSSNENDETTAHRIRLSYNSFGVENDDVSAKELGYTVRCLKN